jgi:hypothetical protein
MEKFIQLVDKEYPDLQSITLHNVGGIISCKCYKKAFMYNQYEMYSKKNNNESSNICSQHDPNQYIYFKKIKTLNGGTRRVIRRTTLRNRRNKKYNTTRSYK